VRSDQSSQQYRTNFNDTFCVMKGGNILLLFSLLRESERKKNEKGNCKYKNGMNKKIYIGKKCSLYEIDLGAFILNLV